MSHADARFAAIPDDAIPGDAALVDTHRRAPADIS